MGIRHGVTLSNGVGVIDSDYRGQVHVGLHNLSGEPYTVNPNRTRIISAASLGDRLVLSILM